MGADRQPAAAGGVTVPGVPVARLFIGTLAWLAPSLFAWWVLSPWIARVDAWLSSLFLHASGLTATVADMRGSVITFSVALPAAGTPPGAMTVAEVEVNAATYTFGLALYFALTLASPRRIPIAASLGAGALLGLIPTWGIAFDLMRQLSGTPDVASLLAWSGAGREAIALAYQLGALLFPTLGPVVAWLAVNRGLWTADRVAASGAPREPRADGTDRER